MNSAVLKINMQELIEAAKALEPYLDAIICYASTMEEHEPNRLAFNLRSALSNAETHLPPAPGSLALGAVPEGGEERGSSVDRPAAAGRHG